MRILAIKLKQIGDVLLWEPALRKIKTFLPDAKLHVLTNDYAFPVIKNAPYVDKFFVISKKKKASKLERLRVNLSFIKSLRKYSYDVVLNFSPGDRSHLYSFLVKAKEKFSYFSPKKEKVQRRIFSKLYTPPNTHTILQDLWFVDQVFDFKFTPPKVRLYLNSLDEKRAQNILKNSEILEENYVVIHPVAGWFLKCLPVKLVAEVTDWFVKNGLKVVITSGGAERELRYVKEVFELVKAKKCVINLAGKVSLEELFWIIKKCRFFFGIDTAPMHIAAALNKPVFAVFGPTGKHNWGPWDNDVEWKSYESPYEQRGSQFFGKHFVYQKDWDCVPCGGKKKCIYDVKFSKCLDINLEDLINHLKLFFC